MIKRGKSTKKIKSQAALEFLTTYAWAFIMILIAIGALYYFGILNPKDALPEKCALGQEIECVDHVVQENGVEVRLKNNAGKPIIPQTLTLSYEDNPMTCISSIDGSVWKAGLPLEVSAVCDFEGAGVTGSGKEKFEVDFKYYDAELSSTFSKSVKGEMLANIDAISGSGGGSGEGGGIEPPLTGSVAGYDFNENSGDTLNDVSGNGNSGIFNGEDLILLEGSISGATYINGQFGNAIQFDGSGDWVSIADNPGIDFGTNSFTITGWIRNTYSGAEYRRYLEKYDGSDGYRFFNAGTDSGKLRFRLDDGSIWKVQTLNYLINDGAWHHLAWVVDRTGEVMMGYIDGIARTWGGGTSTTFSIAGLDDISSTTPLYFGRNNGGGNRYVGDLDEVRLYNRVLSQSEIDADRASVYPIDRTVASYNFNDGSDPLKAEDSHIWVKGKYGSALSFDGLDDNVPILNFDHGVLKQGSENAKWSIAMWAKKNGGTANERIMAGRIGCNGGIYTWNVGAGYAFAIKTTGCWTDSKTIASNPPNIGEWHHLAAVYDDRAMNFYVDGESAGTDTFTSTTYNYGTTFGIGGVNPYLFEGAIDSLAIYDYALTPAEVGLLASG